VSDQKAEMVFQQVIQEQQGEPKDRKRQEAEDHFVNFLGYNRSDAKTLSEIFIKKYKK
jgi:hypothetical protein